LTRRSPERPTFASERALCEAFLAGAAVPDGWTAYPETDGWDILLIRDQVQVGVQAKLRPSLEVLAQAARPLRRWRDARGPHYIAVLVPWTEGNFSDLAEILGLVVLRPWLRQHRGRDGEQVLTWHPVSQAIAGLPPLHFEAPAWVPPVVPDVPAGVPSPVQLTEWKIRALRFMARLEVRGYVTVHDLRDFGMTSSLWYHRWLVPQEGPSQNPPRWVRKPGVALVDAQHPEIFAQFVQATREEGIPVSERERVAAERRERSDQRLQLLLDGLAWADGSGT